MHSLATIPHASVRLRWDRDIAGTAELRAQQLRGALARDFADDDRFHQHDADGRPLYRYPCVQYRWWRGEGLVIGWANAAERLLRLPWLDLALRLGQDEVCVTDAVLTANHGRFEVSPRLLRYRFASPVLLFNQENYQRYQVMNESERRAEQDRLLIAQMLGAMKGLRILFPETLYMAFTDFRIYPCHYKRQKLMGIKGEFFCNAVLPDGFAIGHAVSHGYGWVVSV